MVIMPNIWENPLFNGNMMGISWEKPNSTNLSSGWSYSFRVSKGDVLDLVRAPPSNVIGIYHPIHMVPFNGVC